jgi:pyridoxal phosphate enzyme (YggS family)
MPTIADNLALVRERIAAAARRSGRPASSVRLIAVSKTHPVSAIAQAFAAGQREFGENRVQEALAKQPHAPAGIAWHLIGHVQSNKAKLVPGAFLAVHSVDSVRLIEALDRHAQAAGRTLDVLLQANLSGEATKSGVADLEALEPLLAAALKCRGLKPVGLMTIPDPAFGEAETRAVFGRLRESLDRLRSACGAGAAFCELSMGMTHDYEWAIEEGATLVRVGTAVFGPRPAA